LIKKEAPTWEVRASKVKGYEKTRAKKQIY